MKLAHTFILLFGLFLSLNAETVTKKEIRKADAFDKIKATKGINVTLIEGHEESVEVHIKNGETSDVITEVRNRKLTVKMKTKIYKDVAVQVYVTYQSLREIEAALGATIDSENTVNAENLNIKAGAEAIVKLDIDVNNLEVNGNTCDIELEGVAKYQDIKIGTNGRYKGYNLISHEAFAKATLGSIVEVSVKDKLSGTAGTGGVVSYIGDPSSIETSVNTGGKVKKEVPTA